MVGQSCEVGSGISIGVDADPHGIDEVADASSAEGVCGLVCAGVEGWLFVRRACEDEVEPGDNSILAVDGVAAEDAGDPWGHLVLVAWLRLIQVWKAVWEQ